MDFTPVSLLERLQQPSAAEAWPRFVTIFMPLLLSWARRSGLQEADAADLVQDVFAILAERLPRFRYDPQQSFRGWLRTVLLNCSRDRHKRRPDPVPAGKLDDLAAADPIAELAAEDYRRFVLRRAMRIMRADFQPATWKACWEMVVCSRSAADIAAELGLTVAAVHAARYRVLGRLRQELIGLLE